MAEAQAAPTTLTASHQQVDGTAYLHTRLPLRYMVSFAKSYSQDTAIVYAAHIEVRDGALIFFSRAGDVLTIYPAGAWIWCHLVDEDNNRVSRTP